MDIIAKRRHKQLLSKHNTYNLIYDSYVGGEDYRQGNHLIRYYRESIVSYRSRLERAVYINMLRPLIDILVGYLYREKPEREIPDKISYILNNASRGRSYQQVMQSVAIQSWMFPVVVLVDVPMFDATEIQTVADRQALGINPYLTIYNYKEIRDFAIDDKGELEWVLLDNTYVDDSDPYSDPKVITTYRLWTPTYYQDFIIEKDGVIVGDTVPHPVGRVPAVLCGFKGINDHPESSMCESIALITKSIYNLLSLLDEIIYGHSFSTLFFPVRPGEDLPSAIKEKGIGSLVVVPYDGELSSQPYYAQAGQIDVQPVFNAIKMYVREVFRQVGFSIQEEDNRYWSESGVAKSVEFQKTESILKLKAVEMEKIETDILSIVAAWEGIADPDIQVNYSYNYQADSIDNELERLYRLYSIPISGLQKAAAKRIITKTLQDVSSEEMQSILDEINNPNGLYTPQFDGEINA